MKNLPISRYNTNKGFTIIELLVVVAIIGLISSIVMVGLSEAREKARNSRRLADVYQYFNALQYYYDENGAYPDPGSAWACLGEGYSNGDCYASNINESEALSTALLKYMPALPPGGSVPATNGNLYEGYIYRCTSSCGGMEIRWYMEGIDQSCGVGTFVNSTSNNYYGTTFCKVER